MDMDIIKVEMVIENFRFCVSMGWRLDLLGKVRWVGWLGWEKKRRRYGFDVLGR
jgi:hypothetical protein